MATWTRAFAVIALSASSLVLAQDPPAPDGTRDVRLLTWNVGTCNPMAFRLPETSVPAVIDTIAEADADQVTLQEVCSPAQAEQIARALAERGQAFRIASAVVDARRDDGRLAVTLYRGEAEQLTFSTTNGFGVLALRQGDLTVVNIHAPISPGDRATFFHELARWAKTLPGRVVVIGDYNCGPGQGAGLSTVSSLHRLLDAISFARFTRALPVGTRPEPTNLFGLAIDHVRLISGQVRSQKVLRGRRIFPMDHDPLLAEIRVEVAPAAVASPAAAPSTEERAAPAVGLTTALEAAVEPAR
jgi:endonuclease/exonuclease/phosphatase family metal-dependent hydrolase